MNKFLCKNDCSFIEDVHLLFDTHFMIFVFILGFFFCKMLRGCLVCVICNSQQFSFLNIFKLLNGYSYIEHVHMFVHF